MRWLWLLSGGLGIAAAIVAWAYPDETLRVLALLLGCFLIVAGVLDAPAAGGHRRQRLLDHSRGRGRTVIVRREGSVVAAH